MSETYFCEVRVWRKQAKGNTMNLTRGEAEQLRKGLIKTGVPEKDVRVRKYERNGYVKT